ncbi:MAG: Hint domain-containing protein [Pseudomonadota bacterium]
MPTTFNVIFLGDLRVAGNPDNVNLDPTEGNTLAENAGDLVGRTFGGPGDALADNIQQLTPFTNGRAFDADGNTYYNQDQTEGTGRPERFSVDGVRQSFDATVVYNATLTYTDGTTEDITAVIFQATNGNTYLAPESAANADQTALEAKPIQSITLGAFVNDSWLGMSGDRQAGNFLPCYTPGVRIGTTMGLVAVEDLKIGDLVMTLDHGFQPVRWIGKATRKAEGALVPIRIKAGALGQGLPDRDLVVSPQHRMLLRSRVAARMTGCSEVFVPAKKLLALPGIAYADEFDTVTYIHFLCDQHEIVFAEGAPSETLLTGPQAMAALGPEELTEIETIFPGILDSPPTPARPIPSGKVTRRMVERHLQNDRPLLED